jgi:mono/diheme cytochrome c family protein
MNAPSRIVATLVLTGAGMTGLVFAQAPAAPPPREQAAPPPAQGQGGRGRINAPSGPRPDGFTQFTRPPASPDVILRGKGLYETNCASCHATDLRGTADGKNPNLLRSGVALRDQKGELIRARVAKHTPPMTLIAADTVAIAEYIHSVHATMSGQGSPPGRNPTGIELNVLVGDAKAGATYFAAA